MPNCRQYGNCSDILRDRRLRRRRGHLRRRHPRLPSIGGGRDKRDVVVAVVAVVGGAVVRRYATADGDDRGMTLRWVPT